MTALPEGTVLNQQNFIHLTPGTKIRSGSRDCVVLTHGYAARVDATDVYPLHMMEGYRVVSVGDWKSEPENVTTFKQRARTVCLGSAIENGVSQPPVLSALSTIGANITDPPLGVGMFVHWADADLRGRILTRRGVVLGHGDPNHWDGYAEVDPRRERVTIGGVRGVARTLRVLAMDNPQTEDYLIPPTQEDEAEIARLRGQIWTIGVAAKSANSWCAAYERAVGVLGVSPECATQVTGTPSAAYVVTPDGVPMIERDNTGRDFPVGAVFEYACGQDHRPDYTQDNWNWTRRSAESRPDGHWTRHYFGPNGGHWGGRRRVLWDGTGEMFIPIVPSLMEHLPVGTTLGYRNSTSHYVKGEDGAWTNNDGARAQSNDFFSAAQVRRNEPSTAWHIVALPD